MGLWLTAGRRSSEPWPHTSTKELAAYHAYPWRLRFAKLADRNDEYSIVSTILYTQLYTYNIYIYLTGVDLLGRERVLYVYIVCVYIYICQ